MKAKVLPARFFQTTQGSEPVREFLLSLTEADRKQVGIALAKVEFGWPLGMPVCRHLEGKLWEVRIALGSNRIARVIFTPFEHEAVLLHAFIKKSQQTPKTDLDTARHRLQQLSGGES